MATTLDDLATAVQEMRSALVALVLLRYRTPWPPAQAAGLDAQVSALAAQLDMLLAWQRCEVWPA
jgi:hypothetical protein